MYVPAWYQIIVFQGSINISLPGTYVHMYIFIWDLLYQVGTYVRTYVRYFWGLLIFLYQVRTYALLSGGSLPSTYIFTLLSGIYYTK